MEELSLKYHKLSKYINVHFVIMWGHLKDVKVPQIICHQKLCKVSFPTKKNEARTRVWTRKNGPKDKRVKKDRKKGRTTQRFHIATHEGPNAPVFWFFNLLFSILWGIYLPINWPP